MKEHPEDRQARLTAEAYGRRRSELFAKKYAEDLVDLIATYADEDAQFLLAHLRELFWIETWEPKRRKR